jgi:hypothetical protein
LKKCEPNFWMKIKIKLKLIKLIRKLRKPGLMNTEKKMKMRMLKTRKKSLQFYLFLMRKKLSLNGMKKIQILLFKIQLRMILIMIGF